MYTKILNKSVDHRVNYNIEKLAMLNIQWENVEIYCDCGKFIHRI